MQEITTRRKALKLTAGTGTSTIVLSGDAIAAGKTTVQSIHDESSEQQVNQLERCSPSPPQRVETNESWLMERHDPARTGSTMDSGPGSPATLNWRYTSDGESVLPVIGSQGVIFVTESAPNAQTSILDSDSGQRTEVIEHGGLSDSPPIIGRGQTYVSYHERDSGASKVVIESRDLDHKGVSWKNSVRANTISSKLALRNVIVLGTKQTPPVIQAIQTTSGEPCWELKLDEPNTEVTSLAFHDGSIYVTTVGMSDDTLDTGYCIALNPETGVRRWMTKFSQPVYEISVSDDGPLVRTANSVCLLSADNGEELWQYAVSGGSREAPVIKNDTAFISGNHKITARTISSGEVLWSRFIDSNIIRVRAGNDSLYYTTDAIASDEALVGSMEFDGDPRWSRSLGDRRTTAPVILGEQLVIGTVIKPHGIPGTESYEGAAVEIIGYK